LLDAARALQERSSIVFCFVGGGSEQAKVRDAGLSNVRCLPYQPLNELSNSLSAGDLHVVVMGEKFVGIVHPSKVYNILSIGAPVLYIGPEPSHVTDIASQHGQFFLTAHGDADAVVKAINNAMQRERPGPVMSYSKLLLMSELIAHIEMGQDLHDVSRLTPSPGGNQL
jgi:hypothetical protein